MTFTPSDGSEQQKMKVFEFKNRGGVGMGMYNTDEVCLQFPECNKIIEIMVSKKIFFSRLKDSHTAACSMPSRKSGLCT